MSAESTPVPYVDLAGELPVLTPSPHELLVVGAQLPEITFSEFDLNVWNAMVTATPMGAWFRRGDISDDDIGRPRGSIANTFSRLTSRLAENNVLWREGVASARRYRFLESDFEMSFSQAGTVRGLGRVSLRITPEAEILLLADERAKQFDASLAQRDNITPKPAKALIIVESGTWQDLRNCAGEDPTLFFPERGKSAEPAKAICRGCVVREECLESALSNGEKNGIWGGMSERERRRIRRQRALKRATSSKPANQPAIPSQEAS